MPRNPRLLIVDDRLDLLKAYAPDFEECGFDVVTAHYDPLGTDEKGPGVFHTTQDIVRFATPREAPIDAVLSDIDCAQDEFGVRLSHELLKANFTRPIFTFSEATHELLAEQLRAMGVKELFEKPTSFDGIRAIAQEIHAAIKQQPNLPPH